MRGYRREIRRCPNGESLLHEKLSEDAVLDVCNECHGAWLDWMDGDLHKLTKKLHNDQNAETGENTATKHCPDCKTELRMTQWHGVTLLRCVDCVGSFLDKEAITQLSRLNLSPTEVPQTDPLLTRVLDVLSRVFFE